MALFILNFQQFDFRYFQIKGAHQHTALPLFYEVTCLALLLTKVSWAEVVSDVFSDVSSHILTCSTAVPAKIAELPGLEEGENIFSGQSGDTWWLANGTEMSNISTVPDYKYLTKISQNFLNILVETYTSSVCQSVKTSTEAGLGALSTGLKVAHQLNCVS